jgi:hypothetical protein
VEPAFMEHHLLRSCKNSYFLLAPFNIVINQEQANIFEMNNDHTDIQKIQSLFNNKVKELTIQNEKIPKYFFISENQMNLKINS